MTGATTPRTSRIPEYRLRELPTTRQGRALYERAEEAYPEPWRTEVMATIHRIEEEARSGR